VLPYGSEPPSHGRGWVRVVGWLAIACGIPLCGFIVRATVFHSLPRGDSLAERIFDFMGLLFLPGIVLGMVAVIWSGGRSVVGWIGLLINLSLFGMVGYAYLVHH
jgi:hypothetical protein